MTILFMIFFSIGIVTMINHLSDLRDQNERIIHTLDQLYEHISKNEVESQ